MNVSTIVIPKEQALEKLSEFRAIAKSQRRVEDQDFRRLYRLASQGYPIIDVMNAFQQTGLNLLGQPRLAMARADWKECHFFKYDRRFSYSRRYRTNAWRIPNNAWDWNKTQGNMFTSVPFIPPKLRPKDNPENYWILFEVQDWKSYPADPYLLKRVSGWLYAVVGEWELTELERSLLSGR